MGTNFKEMVQTAWRMDSSPDSLAKGLGVGLFVGFLPLPAFQAVIALAVAHFFGVNRILAMAGTLATNWFTMPAIFVGAVWTGSAILPGMEKESVLPASYAIKDILAVSQDVLLAYAAGTTVFAFLAGISGYALVKLFAKQRR